MRQSEMFMIAIEGIGPDGHIAFNEPGSSLSSRTRIKTLNADTIQANARWDIHRKWKKHRLCNQSENCIALFLDSEGLEYGLSIVKKWIRYIFKILRQWSLESTHTSSDCRCRHCDGCRRGEHDDMKKHFFSENDLFHFLKESISYLIVGEYSL